MIRARITQELENHGFTCSDKSTAWQKKTQTSGGKMTVNINGNPVNVSQPQVNMKFIVVFEGMGQISDVMTNASQELLQISITVMRNETVVMEDEECYYEDDFDYVINKFKYLKLWDGE